MSVLWKWHHLKIDYTNVLMIFQELVQQADMDPFAFSAWISHVFLTIHPFEASFLSCLITLHLYFARLHRMVMDACPES